MLIINLRMSTAPTLYTLVYVLLVCILKPLLEKCVDFYVLDSKWKLASTTKFLDFYYNNLWSIDLGPLQALQEDTSDEFGVDLAETFQINLPNRSVIQQTFEYNLRSLYTEYEFKYNITYQVRRPPPPQQHSFSFQNVYDDPDAQSQLADLYNYITGGRSASDMVSELDLYCDSLFSFSDEGLTPVQIDVLDWWGTHEKDFLILASMAKEICRFRLPLSPSSPLSVLDHMCWMKQEVNSPREIWKS